MSKNFTFLTLENQCSIKTLQELFNRQYPYLKIEFFKEVHSSFKFSTKSVKVSPDEKIGCNNAEGISSGEIIDISKEKTVAALEKDLQDKTGLVAQVFRKSGKVWIETSLTDDWTLGQQNNEGELITNDFDYLPA